MFESQAERSGQSIALVYEEEGGELRGVEQASQSARALLEGEGSRGEVVVGIMMERTMEMVEADTGSAEGRGGVCADRRRVSSRSE